MVNGVEGRRQVQKDQCSQVTRVDREQSCATTFTRQGLSPSSVLNDRQTETAVAAETCPDGSTAAWLQFIPVSLT